MDESPDQWSFLDVHLIFSPLSTVHFFLTYFSVSLSVNITYKQLPLFLCKKYVYYVFLNELTVPK